MARVELACEQFDEILMKQKITIVVLKSYKDVRLVTENVTDRQLMVVIVARF